MATSGGIFCISDLITQYVTHRMQVNDSGRDRHFRMDWKRLFTYSCFGFFLAAPIYMVHYNYLLPMMAPGNTAVTALKRVALELGYFSPFFICYRFLLLKRAESVSWSKAQSFTRERLWPTLKRNWCYYAPV